MSFSGLTPESLLPRSDSKNVSTTCKGLTARGRPCRRALAAAAFPISPTRASPGGTAGGGGVLAILRDRDDDGAEQDTVAAAFYCWQHKDQAEKLGARTQERTRVVGLVDLTKKRRGSIESLAEKMGVLDLESEVGGLDSAGGRQRVRVRRPRMNDGGDEERGLTERGTVSAGWLGMQRPLLTVPEEEVRWQQTRRKNGYFEGRSNVKASWACCIRADDDEEYDEEPLQRRTRPRPGPSSVQQQGYKSPAPMMQITPTRPSPVVVRRKPVPPAAQPKTGPDTPLTSGHATDIVGSRPNPTPASSSSPTSQTQTLLSLIPPTTSPQTAALLLAELSKPLPASDEAGYIYIFWLTPDSFASKPEDETASSLLGGVDDLGGDSDSDSDSEFEEDERRAASTSRSRGQRERSSASHQHHRHQVHKSRQEAALRRFASVRQTQIPSAPSSSSPSGRNAATAQNKPKEQQRTILLKIGRATNVHRRMTQWSKQCGQDITLVRYYPYQTTNATSTTNLAASSANSGNVVMIKCPHIARVERLIHLELSQQRVVDPGRCEVCGREHREWFEVEGSRRGLRGVDGVVKRWVAWGMGLDGGGGGGGGGGAAAADGSSPTRDVRTPDGAGHRPAAARLADFQSRSGSAAAAASGAPRVHDDRRRADNGGSPREQKWMRVVSGGTGPATTPSSTQLRLPERARIRPVVEGYY